MKCTGFLRFWAWTTWMTSRSSLFFDCYQTTSDSDHHIASLFLSSIIPHHSTIKSWRLGAIREDTFISIDIFTKSGSQKPVSLRASKKRNEQVASVIFTTWPFHILLDLHMPAGEENRTVVPDKNRFRNPVSRSKEHFPSTRCRTVNHPGR